MPLAKEHTEFVMREITSINPKLLEIDREFVNLLSRLKHDGYPSTVVRRPLSTVQGLTDRVCRADPVYFEHFAVHHDIVYKWLESDFLSLIHRGKENQQVAAALPMHLNAYRVRNAKYNNDQGTADQVFSLLHYSAPQVLETLRNFLSRGVTYDTDKYDEQTELDIETLLLLRLLDQEERDHRDPRKGRDIPVPLCLGQARVLADDVARLLVYQRELPRLVLISYIKNVLALHLGLYVLRLFQLVPSLLENGVLHDCAGGPTVPDQMDACPFRVEILLDMGEDGFSHMAELARDQWTRHLAQLNTYVRAQITLKKLQEFAQDLVRGGDLAAVPELADLPRLRDYLDATELNAFFKSRIKSLMDAGGEGEPDPQLVAIRKLGLSTLDTYVEMIYLLRQRFHQNYYTQLLDSLFQKNREQGLLRAGYGRYNTRRYGAGSALIETLLQIALLEPVADGFRSRTLRVDEFLEWLRARYGFYISRLPADQEPTIEDLRALRLNVQDFKDRLRDIGFYTDLSDAYVAQVIRPRYHIQQESGT
jgi:hypothetical protein